MRVGEGKEEDDKIERRRNEELQESKRRNLPNRHVHHFLGNLISKHVYEFICTKM